MTAITRSPRDSSRTADSCAVFNPKPRIAETEAAQHTLFCARNPAVWHRFCSLR